MTKNRKIELLINDNKKIIEENRRLHELSNEQLSKNMISEIDRYSKVINLLYGKYDELNSLKLLGIRNHWKYRIMFLWLGVRKMLGL